MGRELEPGDSAGLENHTATSIVCTAAVTRRHREGELNGAGPVEDGSGNLWSAIELTKHANQNTGDIMPQWLEILGNWASSIAVGILALVGVMIGLGGIKRQIKANFDQQEQAFRHQERTERLREWRATQSAAGRLLAEIELQNQLIFERNIKIEISIFLRSFENGCETVFVPQGYNIYSSDRIFEKMENDVSRLPSYLVQFFVRYMGILHYELNRLIQPIDLALHGKGEIRRWTEEDRKKLESISENLALIQKRSYALARMLRLILNSDDRDTFDRDTALEKKKFEDDDFKADFSVSHVTNIK